MKTGPICYICKEPAKIEEGKTMLFPKTPDGSRAVCYDHVGVQEEVQRQREARVAEFKEVADGASERNEA